MDIKLNFGSYNDCYLDDNRITPMLNGDKKSALQMSIWQKIKDFFCTDKKSDAYLALYHLLHDTEGSDKLALFNKLKSFASPEHQPLFEKQIYCNEVLFFVNDEKVGESSLQRLMNISEQTRLEIMSPPEQRLFLEMLDTLREKDALYSDSYSGYIRLKMSNEHCYDLLELYRPQEEVDFPGTELVNRDFLNYKEEKLLAHLHPRGGMRLPNQFASIGYQNTVSGVKFSMLHPSINYLLEGYSKDHYNGDSSIDLNSESINILNKVYHNYNHNKDEIDEVLHKVYNAHGGTLNISFAGRHDNRMVTSPHAEREYLFQSVHSLQDLSDSLDTIFHKWTTTDELVS